jgi:hypothetical protein
VSWWEWCGLAICAVAFLLLRLPLFKGPGLLLGWNSDAALLGLMARAILEGDPPIIFWASDYLAPLTSLFAAAVGLVTGEVGPFTLRVATAIEVFATMLFFHAALRRVVGRRAALFATFLLSAAPAFLFQLTYAPLSAEGYFFLGSIAFWFVMRTRFVRAWHWFALGLMFGIGWWIHRGVSFVIAPALIVIWLYDRALLRRWQLVAGALLFACGAALGMLPIVFGRLAVDQRLYGPVVPRWSTGIVTDRIVEFVRYDGATLIGAEPSPLGWLFGGALLVLLVSAAAHFRPRRETMLAAGVVGTAFAFWFLTVGPYRGALRYIVIALPILYAFASRELVRLGDRSRIAALVAAATLAAGLYVPRWQDVREIVAARREQYELFHGGFDPRPALRVIEQRRYVVCYADVWIAHKLELLTTAPTRFIPYRSVNRRMTESLRLAALPGSKCFVDLSGNVHTLTPRQEAEMRLDTLRLVRGRG